MSERSPARTNLPSELTSFVGRERERREVAAALASARLLTLTGAGGCGKTRLALRVAADLRRAYPDGVFWVELAQLTDPALVARTVAECVGAGGGADSDQAIRQALLAELRGRRALLVLDNCEHLAGACAALAGELLAAPGPSLLATSREPLAVAGEALYPLAPLSLPPLNLPADKLQRFDAVQLFAERARARLPAFSLTAANAPQVAAICRQLDGLPLAIELAAARANVLSLEQIAARLDHRLAWLVAAERGPVAQHRSLRAAIEWSYELLSPDEQGVLRRLSVLAGGCTLAGAEAVTGSQPTPLLEVIASLVNKSLLVAETINHSEARYTLLETIRQYAHEKLATAGEEADARQRHLRHYLAMAEEAAPKLRGPYQELWLNWLQAEHDNLRGALAWALECDDTPAGLRLANALMGYWEMRGHAREGSDWYARLLARPRDGLAAGLLVTSLTYATFLAMLLGDADRAMALGRAAVAQAEAAGPAGEPLLGQALAALGSAAVAAGDHETQFDLSTRAQSFFRAQHDLGGLGMTLLARGGSAIATGRYAVARAALEECLSLFRSQADPFRTAMALNSLGDLERCEQNDAAAQAAYEESAALLRSVGGVRELGSVLHNLAHAYRHRGDTERALVALREAVARQQEQQNTHGLAECLTGFAAVALARGQPGPAARLLAAALALGGPEATTRWPAERREYEAALAGASGSLSAAEFEQEQAAGRAMTGPAAVTYALAIPLAAEALPAQRQPEPGGLTAREREVAARIGQGQTNAEIAAALVVSKRTVEKHIANILDKLVLTSRAQVVRWAIAQGLARPVE